MTSCNRTQSFVMQTETVAHLHEPGDLWIVQGRVIHDCEDTVYPTIATSEQEAVSRFHDHIESERDDVDFTSDDSESNQIIIMLSLRVAVSVDKKTEAPQVVNPSRLSSVQSEGFHWVNLETGEAALEGREMEGILEQQREFQKSNLISDGKHNWERREGPHPDRK